MIKKWHFYEKEDFDVKNKLWFLHFTYLFNFVVVSAAVDVGKVLFGSKIVAPWNQFKKKTWRWIVFICDFYYIRAFGCCDM